MQATTTHLELVELFLGCFREAAHGFGGAQLAVYLSQALQRVLQLILERLGFSQRILQLQLAVLCTEDRNTFGESGSEEQSIKLQNDIQYPKLSVESDCF